jgi:3',5'-cyclic-AMP phosphodiesterase
VGYRLAHLSDLHIGTNNDGAAELLVEALLRSGADRIAVTGDVTHRGRRTELQRFRALFAPVAGRLVCVPGNHDRLGDDLAAELMPGPRVQSVDDAGVRLVRFNSTGEHNRRWFDSHGLLTPSDLEAIETELRGTRPNSAAVLLLHHHLLPLPVEDLFERLATRLGWPNAAELVLGPALVQRLRGACDLVLHGHRHIPAERIRWRNDRRPLRIVNGGSSALLRGFRLFEIDGSAWSERWVDATEPHESIEWCPAIEYASGPLPGW